MTLPLGEIVDLESLWQTAVAAIVAGVGITVAFSLAVLGWTRGPETVGEGRRMVTVLWMVIGLVGLAGAAAAIVLGLIVMAEK